MTTRVDHVCLAGLALAFMGSGLTGCGLVDQSGKADGGIGGGADQSAQGGAASGGVATGGTNGEDDASGGAGTGGTWNVGDPVDVPPDQIASYCLYPLGGAAVRLALRVELAESGGTELDVRKIDEHDNSTASFVDPLDGSVFRDISVTEWQYAESGEWTRRAIDVGLYGRPTVDERWFDDAGNVLKESTDEQGDGSPELVVTNTYDDQDREVQSALDLDGDGTVDRQVVRIYDEDGGSIAMIDHGPDDIADLVSVTTKSEDGLVVLEELSTASMDHLLQATRTTYDEAGHILEIAEDFEQDGSFSVIYTYEYSPDGLLLSSKHYGNEDTLPKTTTTYAYDEDGLLLSSQSVFSSGNQSVTTYVDCP